MGTSRTEVGAAVAVATLGEKGSIAFDGERFYECGIVPAEKVVNTVGAGDSYIAGFTKGVIDGLDIPACMKAGAELSSRVIGSLSRTRVKCLERSAKWLSTCWSSPMLYGEIYTPGDEPDGFGFWSREFGMGHMGPMDWDELQVEMDVCDVQKSVLMPLDVTTACGGHFGTNDQIAMLVAAHPDRLWGFASVDPQVSGAADELGRAFTELGAKGLCLHPAKQGFAPDDAVAEPLYELCERYNKPVVFPCRHVLGAGRRALAQ